MSKFAKVTVRVPVDEGLPVMQLRDHLKDALEERGIETLDLKGEVNGEPLLANAARKGRIYWPAAVVSLTVERATPAQATKPKRQRAQED